VETPVLADYEVDDDILSNYNLLLLGNSQVNSIIARVNDRLPIRFDGTDICVNGRKCGSELGFIEVYPNPLNSNRYIVMLCGNTEDILVRMITTYRNMPDYGVFTLETDFSKPETFAAYGYFDECWRL
jgi:hypothetical protein